MEVPLNIFRLFFLCAMEGLVTRILYSELVVRISANADGG